MPNNIEKEIKEEVPSQEKGSSFEIMSLEEVQKIESGWREKQEELRQEGYRKDLQFLEENKENISPPLEPEVLERAKEGLSEKWEIEKEGVESKELSEKTKAQLEAIEKITRLLGEKNIGFWIGGGFGIDAVTKGKVTREHGDIDAWILKKNIDDLREILSRQKCKVSKEEERLSIETPENVYLDIHLLKEKSPTELEEKVAEGATTITYHKEDFPQKFIKLENIEIKTISAKTLYELQKSEKRKKAEEWKEQYHLELLKEAMEREEKKEEEKQKILKAVKEIHTDAQKAKREIEKKELTEDEGKTKVIEKANSNSIIAEYLSEHVSEVVGSAFESQTEEEYIGSLEKYRSGVEAKLDAKFPPEKKEMPEEKSLKEKLEQPSMTAPGEIKESSEI